MLAAVGSVDALDERLLAVGLEGALLEGVVVVCVDDGDGEVVV